MSYSNLKMQGPSQESLFKDVLKRLGGPVMPSYISPILYYNSILIKHLELQRKICYPFNNRKNRLSVLNYFIRLRELQGKSTSMPENEQRDLSLQEPEQITISQAEEYLMKPYPVWLLTPQGFVIAANLLALWLWEAPQLNHFFNLNVFDIFSRNLPRIPEHKNDEFFRKKIAVLKRLIGGFGTEPYKAFLEYVEHHPYLKKIYDQVQYIPNKQWESQRLWEYSLRVLPPDGPDMTQFLEFQVAVFRLSPGNEFLALYEPHASSKITQSIVSQKYGEAMAIGDVIGYVQNKKSAGKYWGSEQGGGELVRNGERNPQGLHDTKQEMGLDLDRSVLERAVAALAEAREQQLETLTQRRDFPQFVISELQEKLAAAQQERMDWEKGYARTAEAQ